LACGVQAMKRFAIEQEIPAIAGPEGKALREAARGPIFFLAAMHAENEFMRRQRSAQCQTSAKSSARSGDAPS